MDSAKSTEECSIPTDQRASFSSVTNIFEFAKVVGDLKKVKRTGWTRFSGIEYVESVADHSWRMGLLCMLIGKDTSINMNKCIQFAIIHDLAEAVVGDITPFDGITPEEKHKLEEKGIHSIMNLLPHEEIRNDILSIWIEYEKRECVESKLVKDIDRYEMCLQAVEYEQQYPGVNLEEFFSDIPKINHPVVKQWASELLLKRQTILQSLSNETHVEQSK